MMPGKLSAGKVDPSRAPGFGGTGTPAAGHDGLGVLPGSAGAGGWRDGAAAAAPRRGTPGCNSGVRDRNGDKARTPHGNRCPRKPEGGAALRRETPSVFAGGLDRTTISWQVKTSFVMDRKSTRLNSSHLGISYAVFCLKKK